MKRQILTALMLLAVFTILTGILYPVVMTGLAELVFNHRANGSLIISDGTVTGSELIGQPFSHPEYFWGRLSATPLFPYNAAASSGSNLGTSNPTLFAAIQAKVEALKAADPGNNQPIPVDLVTASGSGLDPDISIAAADYQIARVARVRNLTVDTVTELVKQNTRDRQLGILGEPRVNVLKLNMALDAFR